MRIRKASFCLCLCLAWALAAAGVGETAYVRYHSGQDISWPVAVSQAVFENDGQTYQQALAQATLGMALSAFRVPDVALANRGDHISAYLGELGFERTSMSEICTRLGGSKATLYNYFASKEALFLEVMFQASEADFQNDDIAFLLPEVEGCHCGDDLKLGRFVIHLFDSGFYLLGSTDQIFVRNVRSIDLHPFVDVQ